jgi:multisubunit Na+/H+ antiporter MnhG subunit
MSGVTSTASTLGAVLILVAIGLGIFVSPLFVVPIALLVLLVVGVGPVAAFVAERGAPGSPEPTGVPTTREASYDPVIDPSAR